MKSTLTPPFTLLNYGFRIFFLLAGLGAIMIGMEWLALLHGWTWRGAPRDPIVWHVHEMMFGFASAAIAGFLLTAMAAWTGRPPLQGRPLGVLAAAWLTGRLAMMGSAALPAWLTAGADLAFPVLLALTVARELHAGGNRRNYGVAGLVALLAVADGVYHAGRLGLATNAERFVMAVPHVALALIVVIGGRIIPSFTANWLRFTGHSDLPVMRPLIERLALPVTLALAVAYGIAPQAWLTGLLALAALLVHGTRLAGWRGFATLSNPLLAVLHVAYGWLVVGYGALAIAIAGLALPRSGALHALTIGAIGTMILAVMSRVALGHTGRPLQAAPPTVAAYALLSIAASARMLAPLVGGGWTLALTDAAGAAWIAAFVLFVMVYAPILSGPRADGMAERRPGPPLVPSR
ncbi:MAG: NnrS family protein [Gammaproteobacteria bacterium]